MGLISYRGLYRAVLLSILFTGLPSEALTKTQMRKDATYERTEHEYVLSSTREVAVFCDAGDTLVKGDCEGRTELIVSPQNPMLMDKPRPDVERAVYLESKEISEGGRTGWACWSKIVHPDEELRITSAAKCKKAGSTENKALQIKTPRNRGA